MLYSLTPSITFCYDLYVRRWAIGSETNLLIFSDKVRSLFSDNVTDILIFHL